MKRFLSVSAQGQNSKMVPPLQMEEKVFPAQPVLSSDLLQRNQKYGIKADESRCKQYRSPPSASQVRGHICPSDRMVGLAGLAAGQHWALGPGPQPRYTEPCQMRQEQNLLYGTELADKEDVRQDTSYPKHVPTVCNLSVHLHIHIRTYLLGICRI